MFGFQTFIHELCHVIAFNCFDVPVDGVRISSKGEGGETRPNSSKFLSLSKEGRAICYVAGPIGHVAFCVAMIAITRLLIGGVSIKEGRLLSELAKLVAYLPWSSGITSEVVCMRRSGPVGDFGKIRDTCGKENYLAASCLLLGLAMIGIRLIRK